MIFTLRIECDNAAFRNEGFETPLAVEVERILERVCCDLHTGRLVPGDPTVLEDTDGNKVGHAEFGDT